MKHRNPLITPLILLIVLFLVLLIVGQIIFNKAKAASDYLINVSVEVLGAIITIVFIDFYLNNHEKKIADKREAIALTLLKPLMRSNFTVLFTIYKASTTEKGHLFKTSELRKFLTDDYIVTISRFNLLGIPPTGPTFNWTNYLQNEFSKLNASYDSLLDKYSSILTPELVETIESIKNSNFHTHMTSGLTIITTYTSKQGFILPNNIFGQMFTKKDIVEPYFNSLIQLLKLTEDKPIMTNFFEIDDEQWRDDVSPKIGSSRLN